MLSRFLIAGLLAFLLLGAGQGVSQAARFIPWDCADWQAFAHADRATSILESLAENRGKTIYCGIDQSDTFGKAETWAAGRDHNERDSTEYQGENGRFRGFIAAQEGWLTEGESGITGQSIAIIFEFPRDGKRVKRTKRFALASAGNCPDPHADETGDPPPGTLACSDWGPLSTTQSAPSQPGLARRDAKRLQANEVDGMTRGTGNDWTLAWATFPTAAYWQERAERAARNACRARGAHSASNVVFGQGHSTHQGSGAPDFNRGPGLGWFFRDDPDRGGLNFAARQSRSWTAICKKTVRRTR